MLKVHLGALESILPSSNTRIGNLESQLASKNSEFNVAAPEFELIECLLRFTQDETRLIWEQVPSQGPQLSEVEVARVAAEVAWATKDSNVLSLTTSESVLRGEVTQSPWCAEDLLDEVFRACLECDRDMENVFFERDVLQGRLFVTASQLLGAQSSLMIASERLEHYVGRSTASYLRLESLPLSLLSSFVDEVARLPSDRVAAHSTRLMGLLP